MTEARISAAVFERWMYSSISGATCLFSDSMSATWPPTMPFTVPAAEAISVTHGDGAGGIDGSGGDGFEGLGEQGVAGEDGDGVAEFLVARGLAAAEVVVVESGEIVVDEGIGVDEFDGAGRVERGVDRMGPRRRCGRLRGRGWGGCACRRRERSSAWLRGSKQVACLARAAGDRGRRQRQCDPVRRRRGVLFRRQDFSPIPAQSSRLGLLFGIEGLGGEFAVGFLQQNFDAAFGVFELLLAFAGERDTFFEEFHGVVERELRAFQAADDFFEASERFLEVGLFCRGGSAGFLTGMEFTRSGFSSGVTDDSEMQRAF